MPSIMVGGQRRLKIMVGRRQKDSYVSMCTDVLATMLIARILLRSSDPKTPGIMGGMSQKHCCADNETLAVASVEDGNGMCKAEIAGGVPARATRISIFGRTKRPGIIDGTDQQDGYTKLWTWPSSPRFREQLGCAHDRRYGM